MCICIHLFISVTLDPSIAQSYSMTTVTPTKIKASRKYFTLQVGFTKAKTLQLRLLSSNFMVSNWEIWENPTACLDFLRRFITLLPFIERNRNSRWWQLNNVVLKIRTFCEPPINNKFYSPSVLPESIKDGLDYIGV